MHQDISDAHLSEGLNPYSYVFNSPTNWVDPSGFQADLGPSSSSDAASYSYPTGCPDCGGGATGTSGYDALGPTDANGNPTTTADIPGIDAFPPSDFVGTPTMLAGMGTWSPGSGQTGDVVPSEGTSQGGMGDNSTAYNQINSTIEFSLNSPVGPEDQSVQLAAGPAVVVAGVPR